MILFSCVTVLIIGIAFIFSLYKEYNIAAFAIFVLLCSFPYYAVDHYSVEQNGK